MASLYDLTSAYEEFFARYEAGEIPDEAFDDTLEALEGELNEKIDNIGSYAKDLRGRAAMIEAEITILEQRRKLLEKKAERILDYAKAALTRLGVTKYESARNVMRISTSHPTEIEDRAAFVEWAREHADDLLKFTPSPSLTAIAEAIKDGRDIPYCKIGEKINITCK